jgi:hypothetical protein
MKPVDLSETLTYRMRNGHTRRIVAFKDGGRKGKRDLVECEWTSGPLAGRFKTILTRTFADQAVAVVEDAG